MKRRDITKVILTISIATNTALVGGGALILYKKGGVNYLSQQLSAMQSTEKHAPYYRQKVSIFEALNTKSADVVMIGDSITDHGEWSEMFPNRTILNRGISDDTTGGVLDRLPSAIESKPRYVFILIGVNDIVHGVKRATTLSNYASIIDKIKEYSPRTKIVIQSVFPVNNYLYGNAVSNKEVLALNKSLLSLSKSENVDFLDIYSGLARDGALNKEYTIDGIHLNGRGYSVWKENLERVIVQ